MKLKLFYIVVLCCFGLSLAQQRLPVKHYTYYDGLPADGILAIGQDSLGLIYLKTEKGSSIFNGKDFRDLDLNSSTAVVFNQTVDSLPGGYLSLIGEQSLTVTFQDRQKSWWVGTTNGGLFYFPAPTKEPRELFIQYVGLNNNRLEQPSSELSVPYYYETLTIGYTCVDYSALGRLQYRYQIEGVHDQWVLTRDQKVQFTALPHGKTYRFSVAVQQVDGSWSKPAVLIMKFEQAFYQSTWFLALIGVLILLLIWGLTRSYFKRKANWSELNSQLHKLEGQALQSQMNPHFVFNSLNSIQSFISSGDELKAEVYLAKFSDLLRKTLEASKADRIPLTEEIGMLDRYLELESMRFGDRLNYKLSCDPKLETDLIQVPAMLIQPFVENAVVHGLSPKPEGGTIRVDFLMETDQILLCKVIDNGVGRGVKTNPLHQSMGTDIVQRRLELIAEGRSELVRYNDLEDDQGKALGTEVLIRIPV